MSHIANPSWPEIVGYRHEILHTGVLQYLLNDPRRGPMVARALTGAEVAAVRDVAVERRVRDSRRVADLVATLELQSGDDASLGVETKVDSNATQKQLEETVQDSRDRGVLLALGITALHLTALDLLPGLEKWSVVDPACWATVLKSTDAQDDQLLNPYLGVIEREARQHGQARELAHRRPLKMRLPDSRRGDGLLEHYGWLAEVRGELAHPSDWWTYTNRSGPLMGYLSSEFRRFGDRNTYLEFVCANDQRVLCLKLGAGSDDLLATAGKALAAVLKFGWQPPRHRPSGSAGSCTAARLDFSRLNAAEAAARTRQAIAEVRG